MNAESYNENSDSQKSFYYSDDSKNITDQFTSFDRYGFNGGEQYEGSMNSHLSNAGIRTLCRREIKWQNMLTDWKKWMSYKKDHVRTRCRKGIPASIRPRVWQYLCGSRYYLQQNWGKYQKLLDLPNDPNSTDEIKRDLHRQFPNHLFFTKDNGMGQTMLFNILRAYCHLYPDRGYCQAQAPLAAALIIHLPEEEAFWTFVCLCDQYLINYFQPGLERVKNELNILMMLVQKYQPEIHKYLIKYKIEPILFAVDWFMCLFTRNLQWTTVLRIWDMFLFEGIKVIFRISLAILELLFSNENSRSKFNSMEQLLTTLRKLPREITTEEVLIPCSLKYCKLTTNELIQSYIKCINSSGC